MYNDESTCLTLYIAIVTGVSSILEIQANTINYTGVFPVPAFTKLLCHFYSFTHSYKHCTQEFCDNLFLNLITN